MTTLSEGGRPDVAPSSVHRNDWGMILVLIACLVVTPSVMVMTLVYDEPAEIGWNVDYVRRAAIACPPISPRIDGLLADGRVTDDERNIVPTLRDQARAAPGGLDACQER